MALQRQLRLFDWEDGGVYYEKDIIKLLNSNELQDKQKLRNMIEEAVDNDDEVSLRYLLKKGYKIGPINGSGQTFLHYAFYMGGYGILSTGMKYWVPYVTEDVVKIVDSNGLTVLHVACFAYQSKQFIEKCLEYDADVNAHFSSDPNKQERDGFTPLHLAAVNFEGANWMKLLIDRNADVNAKDSRGRTPLHVACRAFEDPEEEVFGSYVDKIKVLLDANADVNAKDDEGNTPLLSLFPESYDTYTFIEYSILDVPVEETTLKLKLLLERGADLNLTNDDGDTIIHLIIKNLEYLRDPDIFHKPRINFRDDDHVEMIRLIFNTRPNVNFNVTNLQRETPLELAIFYLSADILKILLSNGTDSMRGCLKLYFIALMSHHTINNVSQLEEVVNFLNILELLVNEGLEIDSEQTLEILAYLVHENCDGKCGYFKVKNQSIVLTNLLDAFNFGSSSHFQNVYKKLMAGFNLLVDNLKFRKYANFYIDATLPGEFTSCKELEIPIKDEILVKLESELDRMKSTKMRESVTLYDVMTKHSHNIYQYLADVDLGSVVQNYSLYEDIIRGHLTKALVKHYVEKSAFDSLIDLIPPSCPSLCCKIIMKYLRNEDILNVCRAVVDES